MLITRLTIALSITFACLIAPAARAAAGDAELWRALGSGNHVLFMRHAYAPGVGDPDNFKLGDCSTQRNLSQAGRDQAARIGALLRENGIGSARVYSSQWCRAAETARLLGLGAVTELPALNSFFSRGDGAAQTQTLLRWIAQQDLRQPLVLVTHQVNITAIAGDNPASGEIVILRRAADGKLSKTGSLSGE